MAKYRSKIDFAAILAGNKEGFNLGVDGQAFIRKEAAERVFNPPRIGTQGSSVGAAAASDDISAGTDNQLKVAVDGGAVVNVTLVNAGLTTGALIAAELETKINAALAAAAQDGRVWVEFDIGDDHYAIRSQTTGLLSSVVVTPGAANNVADDLKLGVANLGTEAAGTNDQDYLLYTTGGAKFEQPVESNPHRSERFHVGVIKAKKVVDFDLDTMINMSGSAGDSIDTALRLLLESAFGYQEVVPGLEIKYKQAIPNFTFSMVKASTIFAEYFTGCYVKDFTMTVPGDGPGTYKFAGMGSDGAIAGIGKLNGAVVASTNIILENSPYKQVNRFSAGARVMVVDTDGRTILAGYDGSLLINSVTELTDTVVLNSAVSAGDGAYLTFWHPGAVQTTGRDAVYTDLEGSLKLNSTGPAVCATNVVLTCANDHVDRANCFGTDTNQGFVPGNRMTMTLEVTADLSGENLGDLVKARQFGGFSPELIIGSLTGRYLKLSAPKWVPSVPAIELPENGTTPVTLSGILYQSAAGQKDPLLLEYL